jgi:hypothetical protein
MVGLCLIDAGSEAFLIQSGERLAGLHHIIEVDEDLGNLTGKLGAPESWELMYTVV